MDNKLIAGIIILFAVLALSAALNLNSNSENKNVLNPSNYTLANAEIQQKNIKLEVIHFHGNSQCASCIAIGKCAEDTVAEFFQHEQAIGRLNFSHVNAELAENKALAEKYGVTGSSVWIGSYDGNNFTKEENVNVWYKTGDPEGCKAYFRGILEKRLAGDTS